MENLIKDLISKFESKKSEENIKIQNLKKVDDEKIILFHAGKILAFEYCINELERLLQYEMAAKRE